MPKARGYAKTLKVKEGNNKLMFFHINDEKLLGKYNGIWTKIEDLKNIELNALPVYDDSYMKIKIRTYDDKVNNDFCDINVPEDYIECEFFTCVR